MSQRPGWLPFALLVLAVALPRQGQAETLLERGAYLMNSIVACGNCHTPQGPDGPLPGMELAGGLVIEDPAFTVRPPNITPDPETGIGTWTDDQIIAAIREGRRPDGRIIGPPMPIGLYRQMSDRDVQALVAYLRQVRPVRNQVRLRAAGPVRHGRDRRRRLSFAGCRPISWKASAPCPCSADSRPSSPPTWSAIRV